MKRRYFLKQSTLASGALLLPAITKSLNTNRISQHSERTLVVVHLQGGNDGLNTVVPYTNDTYYQKRPKLAIPKNEVIRLNETFGLNPALKNLMPAYEQGQMLVLNNVGCSGNESSHSYASRIWQTGCPYLKEERIWTDRLHALQLLQNSSSNFNSDDLAIPIPANCQVCNEYEFTAELKRIALQIKLNPGISTYHIALDGFDTHQFQRITQDRLLQAYADGMKIFINQLKLEGQLDRTLIMTYSEFGRTTAQNVQQGTGHGAANNIFIHGSKLKSSGISKNCLNLEDLTINPLLDFRCVYTTILEKWFNIKASLVLNSTHQAMNWI